MEQRSSLAIQKQEHTGRNRTADLFFQSEFALTSPREPDDPSELNPNMRDLLAEPFSTHNKCIDDFSKQGAQSDHFSACQKENQESYMMVGNNQDIVNIANLPIYEEPDWYIVSRPGTILPPPLSPIQNPIIQHEFTKNFSDWLIHGANSSPNTCQSTFALRGIRKSQLLHPNSQDVPDLEMQNVGINSSGCEPVESNQLHTKETHYELLPIEMKQHLRPRNDAINEFLGDENVLVPYDLDGFIPSNFMPMGLPHNRLLSARDNTTRSALIDHLYATGLEHVLRPRYKNRGDMSGTRLLSSLRSAEIRNPSHLSINQTLSLPQSTREHSSSSHYRDEEAKELLQAGQIYLAYLNYAAATPSRGSGLSNTEELAWAHNRLPVEVKKWLKFTNDRSSSIEPLLISDKNAFSSTTTLTNQTQHGKFISKQWMSKSRDALYASRSDSQLSKENAEQQIKCSFKVHENIDFPIPTLRSDTVMEINPVESNFVPARHIKIVARIEARSERVQETSISDEITAYRIPAQSGLSSHRDPASYVSSWTGQGYQPDFPTFCAGGNTFVTPATSQNIVNDKSISPIPGVHSLQSKSADISPCSNESFFTAEDDEVSLIPQGLSSEAMATTNVNNSNSGRVLEDTEIALGARCVATFTDKLFGPHLDSEHRPLQSQQNQNANILHYNQHHSSTSLFSGETVQIHEDNLVVNSVRTTKNREDFPRSGNMMVDIVDKSTDAVPGISVSNEAPDMQSHDLPKTQSKQSKPIEKQTSTKAAKEHLQSSDTLISKDTSSPTDRSGYFCQKCDKAYKKKVYLLKHEKKCVHRNYESPQMPSLTDFKSIDTISTLSMPTLDCKLPNGNSYCSACNKEFSAVGRLRLHLEKACPILKQAGIYNGVKETKQTAQEIEVTKEQGDQEPPTSLHIQPEASSTMTAFRSNKAESELAAVSPPLGKKISKRKDSLSSTKASLNTHENLNLLNMGGTSYSHNFLRRVSMESPRECSSEPVETDSVAVPPPLRQNRPLAADRIVTPVRNLLAQKQLGFSKASDNLASESSGSSTFCVESDNASDNKQLLARRHLIQGDDKDCILRYPERTRLFSKNITSSPSSVHSHAVLFEDISKISKSTTTRQVSFRPDNIDPSGLNLAVTENKEVDKVSSLIVSVPSKTLCGVAYRKIEKDLAAGGDGTKNLMVWPSYEVPASSVSTFEFKITAPDGFNLIATIKQILPKLVFRQYVDKGWVAVLQTMPLARQTSTNFHATEDFCASSGETMGVKNQFQVKLDSHSHGKEIASVCSSGSHFIRNSSAKPADLMHGKKRKSSRLSELNNKDKKDTSVACNKRRKLGK